MTINWLITKLDNIPSTQSALLEKVINEGNGGIAQGSVLHSLKQSDGKGRHGREWHEGKGNLYFSLLLRPECDVKQIGQVSLALGLAVSTALNRIISKNYKAVLKWPNDILIEDKKCCGILIDAAPVIEGKISYLVVGIGVNIHSSPLDTSTSLEKITNSKVDMDNLLADILSNISKYYLEWQKDGFINIREEWLINTCEKGREMSIKIGTNHIKGKFETIDLYGNLVLISDDKGQKIKVSSGDVFLL